MPHSCFESAGAYNFLFFYLSIFYLLSYYSAIIIEEDSKLVQESIAEIPDTKPR